MSKEVDFNIKLYEWYKQLYKISKEMNRYYSDFNDCCDITAVPFQIEVIANNINEEIDTHLVVNNEIDCYNDEIAKIKLRLDKLEKRINNE